MTSPDDPQERIADLEKQVADARRIADLEKQLADARAQETPGPVAGNAFARESLRSHFSEPDTDTRLATAPRRVPTSFVVAELLPFRWWYVFALFMVAIPPIALWISHPALVAPAAVAALVAIYGYQFLTAQKRLALLKWGALATVTGSEIASRASYYSGTTWYNVWLPQAHGWTVSRELWSGPNTKTLVHYALGNYQGGLKISGRSYDDGVILADERHPERALCVSSFAYDLDRDGAGNWVGRIRPRLKIGMAVWLLIVVAWLGIAAGITTGFVPRLVSEVFATRISQGGTARVSGLDTTKVVYCNDGHLTASGNTVTYTVHGHCVSLKVSGIDNIISVDSVDTITLGGIGNRVIYHSGSPKVAENGGSGNSAAQG